MTNRSEMLERAKEKAHREGKEAFDFILFAAIYPHDTGNCERLSPNEPDWVRAEYERRYYLDFPEVRTVREFAEALDRIDESY